MGFSLRDEWTFQPNGIGGKISLWGLFSKPLLGSGAGPPGTFPAGLSFSMHMKKLQKIMPAKDP
jgi:hypothetical protein